MCSSGFCAVFLTSGQNRELIMRCPRHFTSFSFHNVPIISYFFCVVNLELPSLRIITGNYFIYCIDSILIIQHYMCVCFLPDFFVCPFNQGFLSLCMWTYPAVCKPIFLKTRKNSRDMKADPLSFLVQTMQGNLF